MDDEFLWDISQWEVDAVFRPGIGTPLSSTAFENLEMGGSVENPILLNVEAVGISPSRAAISERPNRFRAMLRSCPLGTKIENVPGCLYEFASISATLYVFWY